MDKQGLGFSPKELAPLTEGFSEGDISSVDFASWCEGDEHAFSSEKNRRWGKLKAVRARLRDAVADLGGRRALMRALRKDCHDTRSTHGSFRALCVTVF